MSNFQEMFYAPNTVTEYLYPKEIKANDKVKNYRQLLEKKSLHVSFHCKDAVEFTEKGSYVLLDFGKEVCGGIRLITVGNPEHTAEMHIRFGESLSEAVADLGEKNAQNAHSPRDFQALVPGLSDLTFGQSGFRFAFIELCSETPVLVQSIVAANTTPDFPMEAKITTNDEELNQILDTAAYTVKLCHQNGVIWDGIKRDRLVWMGDSHQEILTSFYLFGDNENIRNSLLFTENDTLSAPDQWVNWMPTYSMWWIICLCDYCKKSGNYKFFEENAGFAEELLARLNALVSEEGHIAIKDAYFLDWPTKGTLDAEIGTAALLMITSEKFLSFRKNNDAEEMISKLSPWLKQSMPISKQVNAFKVLSGVEIENIIEKIERNGSEGFSTFMTYYILKAYKASGGKNSLNFIKEYFGGMLSRGATTFWEDFDIAWLKDSGRIDAFVEKGKKDIHGDYGNHCYLGFRHSLCHGWSSGVFAFFIEEIMGVVIENNRIMDVKPSMSGLEFIKAELPVNGKLVSIEMDKDHVTVH